MLARSLVVSTNASAILGFREPSSEKNVGLYFEMRTANRLGDRNLTP